MGLVKLGVFILSSSLLASYPLYSAQNIDSQDLVNETQEAGQSNEQTTVKREKPQPVWNPAHWVYTGNGWRRVKADWAYPPSENVVWEKGHYQKSGHTRNWVNGRWKEIEEK